MRLILEHVWAPILAPMLTWGHGVQGDGSLSTHLDMTDGLKGRQRQSLKILLAQWKKKEPYSFSLFMHACVMKVKAD